MSGTTQLDFRWGFQGTTASTINNNSHHNSQEKTNTLLAADVLADVKTPLVVFTSMKMGGHAAITQAPLSIYLFWNVTLLVDGTRTYSGYKNTVITSNEGN